VNVSLGCISEQGGRFGALLTSAVVDVLYLGSGEVNASLYSVYLVGAARIGET